MEKNIMRKLMPVFLRLLSLLAAIWGLLSTTPSWAEGLAGYKADPDSVTISGVSSGGAQAVQAHVAYSGTFRGAAVFAGTPYYCAQGQLANFAPCALNPHDIPVKALAETTRNWAEQGLIDPVANLRNSKVYLFSGTRDAIVRPAAMDALLDYYRQFVPADRIRYVNDVPAAHAWVSPQAAGECGKQKAPYLNHCDIDPQKDFLGLFYGELKPKATSLHGRLISFDQAEFIDGDAAQISMDRHAWLFVPPACAQGETCRLHVALHGCGQAHAVIGQAFMQQSGLNPWAETNRILVLYPQVRPSLMSPFNPEGCWDWWGYTGSHYAQKSAPQLRAIKRMVDRLTSGAGKGKP